MSETKYEADSCEVRGCRVCLNHTEREKFCWSKKFV
jgi:hypothetical protein